MTDKTVWAPPPTLLVKLGSIIEHYREFNSPRGHEFDKTAAETLLKDPEVVAWMDKMRAAAMLPVRR